MSGSADLLRELLSTVDERRDGAAKVLPAVIASRDPDGSSRIRISGGRCAVRDARRQQGVGDGLIVAAPGQTAVRPEPTTAGPGLATTSSIAPPILWVESVDPGSYEQGFAGLVTVTGRGFDVVATEFAFLVEIEGVLSRHPGISVTSAEILDAETAEIEIAVDADADLVTEAPLGYTNTGGLPA